MTRKQQIKQLLEKSDHPLSTKRIAEKTGANWHTVNKDLKELHDEGRVTRKELSNRLTLWWDRDIPL